jgi:hypothetical protein
MWSMARIDGAMLFEVNSVIAYLLMPAVMSFNRERERERILIKKKV